MTAQSIPAQTIPGGWDSHTHIIPPAVIAAGESGRYGMSAEPDLLKILGRGVATSALVDINSLLKRVGSDALDGAVVFIPPPLFRPDLEDGNRESYASFVNDSLLSACDPHRRALRPCAYLPIEAPELSAEIASTLDHNWVGTVAGTELGALSFASSRYDSLWDVLSRRRIPLFIHPGASPDPRLDAFYLSNLLGNPVETTIAAANLVFSGVMERFPDLHVILAHGGGCLAALSGRWQQAVRTSRPGIPKGNLSVNDAVRRFYVDSVAHSPAYLKAIIEVVGEDRVLLGSDWPFPMGTDSAEHDIGPLDATLKLKIRKTNAEAAFAGRL